MKRLLLGLAPLVVLVIAAPASAAEKAAPMLLKGSVNEADDQTAKGLDERFSVFSGVDITSQGRHNVYFGGVMAPVGDLDTSGLRVTFLGETGIYKTHTGDTITRGGYNSASLLAGYGIELEKVSVAIYVGPNAETHRLSDPDPQNPLQGTAVGLKTLGELSVNPIDHTWLFGEASYSTAFRTYYAKAKFGYDVSDGEEIFVGPEVIVLGNFQHDELRVGAHVTAIKFGKAAVGFAGGYLRDSEWGRGAYGTIQLDFKF